MASIEEAIRRMIFEYRVEGAEKVAAAQKEIASSTQKTEQAALSLDKGFGGLERKYVDTVRVQQNYRKDLEKLNAALAQDPTKQARYDVILREMEQGLSNTSRGLNTYGKALDQSTQQGRLARHELINLSRQFQDVGVGIVSGQSPFTILVQQGAQIADVFATSTGTLGGFFGQVAAGAGRFAMSWAGIATGVAAAGAAIVYTAASYASGQRDIERALSGIGQASGVTRHQINQIAETSATAFGLSVSEAREAATAFAATGRIYEENVGSATKIINDYASAGGDAAEMTKKLAAALQDPAKGALELNKELGFLDATTLDYIRSMQAQGKLQEAQNALMAAAGPAIQNQVQHVGTLTKMWNVATNAMKDYFDRMGRGVLRDVERATGVSAGGFTKEEQLARAQEQLQRAQEQLAKLQTPQYQARPLLAQFETRQAEENVRRLEKTVADLNKELGKTEADKMAAQLRLLSTDATLAADAIMPATAQIRQMREALAKLREYREQTGGPVTGAEQVGAVKLAELQQQEAATVRVAQATQQIAALYPGMSIETAKQLHALDAQLPVIQARSAAERLVAQEIARQIELLAQGKAPADAMALAAKERQLAEAQITKEIQQQAMAHQASLQAITARTAAAREEAALAAARAAAPTSNIPLATLEAQALETLRTQRNQAHADIMLQYQVQLQSAQAVTGAEKLKALEAQTYVMAIQQGFTAQQALAQAAMAVAVAQAQINAQAQQTLFNLQNQYAVAAAITGQERIRAQEIATMNALIHQGVDAYLAASVAAQERTNAEAAATAAVIQQTKALENQIELIQARRDGTEASVKAEQAYTAAIEAGADTRAAAALADATYRLEREQEQDRELAKEEQIARARQQAHNELVDQLNRETEAYNERIRAQARLAAQLSFVSELAYYTGPLFQAQGGGAGGLTQFDPSNKQQAFWTGWEATLSTAVLDGLMRYGNRRSPQSMLFGAELTSQGIAQQIDKLLGSTGNVIGALNEFMQGGPGRPFMRGTPQLIQDQAAMALQLIDLIPKEQQAAQIEKLIQQVKQQPISLARELLIKQLNEKLKGLTDSVDALNGVLSPYYSQDPRTTKLGFRAGSIGNPDWLKGLTNKTALDAILGPGATAPGGITKAVADKIGTAMGEEIHLPVTSMYLWKSTAAELEAQKKSGIIHLGATAPGMASGGSFIVGGGYSASDNRMVQFPAASGEQVVVNRRPQDTKPTIVHNDNRIIIQGSVDEDTLSKLKISRYQQTQRMRGAMSAA